MKRILDTLSQKWTLIILITALIACSSKREEEPLSLRFNHIFLNTADMDRSVKFYTSAFDLKVTKEIRKIKRTPAGEETVEMDIYLSLLKFPGQNFVLEIGYKPSFYAENTRASYTHLGIDVKDINAASQRVLKAGGVLLRPITLVETEDIKAKNVFFKGPDGETIELMQMMAGEF